MDYLGLLLYLILFGWILVLFLGFFLICFKEEDENNLTQENVGSNANVDDHANVEETTSSNSKTSKTVILF